MNFKQLSTGAILVIAGLPAITRGATDPDNPLGTIGEPAVSIETALKNLTGYALGLVAVAAIFYIIYSGFLIVSAGGDAEKVEKGKKGVMYAIIGLIIAVLAQVIVNFVIGAVAG